MKAHPPGVQILDEMHQVTHGSTEPMSHVTNQAGSASYNEIDDIFEAEPRESTLDGRKPPICQSLDGKVTKGIPPVHLCISVVFFTDSNALCVETLRDLGDGGLSHHAGDPCTPITL